jgi:hypothetical protein
MFAATALKPVSPFVDSSNCRPDFMSSLTQRIKKCESLRQKPQTSFPSVDFTPSAGQISCRLYLKELKSVKSLRQ